MINILLIENQQRQFESIRKCFLEGNGLRSQYKIVPNQNIFIEFIDNVRVWVNKSYDTEDDTSYRENAMNYIIKMIDDNSIDIILMDNKLGAGHKSETGIELAEEINKKLKENRKQQLPIVFISNDIKDTEEISDKLKELGSKKNREEFPAFEWVHKGYFGDEILNEKYIKEYVIEKGINEVLKETEGDELRKIIKIWLQKCEKAIDVDDRKKILKELLESSEPIDSSIRDYIIENKGEFNLANISIKRLKGEQDEISSNNSIDKKIIQMVNNGVMITYLSKGKIISIFIGGFGGILVSILMGTNKTNCELIPLIILIIAILTFINRVSVKFNEHLNSFSNFDEDEKTVQAIRNIFVNDTRKKLYKWFLFGCIKNILSKKEINFIFITFLPLVFIGLIIVFFILVNTLSNKTTLETVFEKINNGGDTAIINETKNEDSLYSDTLNTQQRTTDSILNGEMDSVIEAIESQKEVKK
jgi:hypothetical protein